MTNAYGVALAAAITFITGVPARPAQPKRPPTDPQRGALVRVDASGCGRHARRGSGFAWSAPGKIVTALHVVIGCSNIGVRYPVGRGQYRTASISRVLRGEDLALLDVDSPPPVSPLQASSGTPGPGAHMVVWGYPAIVRGLLDTDLRRRRTGGTLDALVNDSVRKQIQAVGMPDLQSTVLYLDGGTLLPGHSGAPLVDSNDEVVGIADGGLELGAAGISWAIPASHLEALAASNEAGTSLGGATDALFAADDIDPAALSNFDPQTDSSAGQVAIAPSVTWYGCASARFAKVRTRTLAELFQTADDIPGLQQLVFGGGNLLSPTDRYDIFQDPRTGATVVTPAGARMRDSHGFCIVDVLGTTLQEVIRVSDAPNPAAVQNESVQYESDIGSVVGAGWVADPNWTWLTPVTRPDGAIVRHKGNIQMTAGPFGPVPTRYAFESLSAKNGHFLGVTSIRNDLSPQMLQMQQACLTGAQLLQCPAIIRELRLVAQLNIATHLSTFPIN